MMKNIDLIQSLVVHVLKEETGETQDLSAPDEKQVQPRKQSPGESVLLDAAKNNEFKRLIVFRPQTGLWEVVVTPDGRVVATQLKLTKTNNTLEPAPEDVSHFEKNFGLDRGINALHVTVIK